MTTITLDPRVGVAATAFLTRKHQLLIDGPSGSMRSRARRFRRSIRGTGRVIADVAEGGAADIDLAVAAARRAFRGPWSRVTPADRTKMIWKLATCSKSMQKSSRNSNRSTTANPLRERDSNQVERRRPALHGRLGDEDHGLKRSRCHRRGRFTRLPCANRSASSTDHSVERAADDVRLETGAGTRHWLHRRPEAGGTNAADRVAARRTHCRRRHSRRRRQHRARIRRDRRRGARRAPRRRQNRGFTGSGETGRSIIQAAAGNFKKFRSNSAASRP